MASETSAMPPSQHFSKHLKILISVYFLRFAGNENVESAVAKKKKKLMLRGGKKRKIDRKPGFNRTACME